MHYVIGDVHGCYKELKLLINKIESRDTDAIIYFVGDWVDRGPQVADVMQWVVDNITTDGKYRSVRGNHDQEAMDWYNKMWSFTVELFRNMDIPVRTLECCSGDLADLKVKSCDVEAWSPRQQKYFEVGSCSTLGDAQARRLGIRSKGEKGTYYVNTLNNTVLASTRALIALIENNYNEDGSVNIPKVLQPYMGGKEKMVPTKK